jgi:threonine/homoserine/homoserine lactone efflux protein
MPFETWIIYVATVLAFMSTPGPSQLLMLTNSMTHGFKPALATAAGDLTANALQMLAAALGLAAILSASQHALTVIKWAGAAYLCWMGIKMILSAEKKKTMQAEESHSLKKLWLQGFFTSAANPKAVVFFAAFLPQFVSAEGSFALQYSVLAVTYLLIDGVFLSGYGAGASWIASKLKGAGRIWVNRLGGVFMIGAAVLLSLKTMREAT